MHGDLGLAERQARDALALAPPGGVWHTRFLVELARIRLYQGFSDEAVSLLKQPLRGDVPVALRADHCALLAIALTQAGSRQAALRLLAEAHRSLEKDRPDPKLESARGSIALDAGALDESAQRFHRVLAAADAANDRFLEMQALLNLGVIDLRQEHYEDALDHFGEARGLAEALGAQMALEKIVGNVGYVYYGLGDMERALQCFREAEAEAARVDAPVDRTSWINNEGLSEFRAGNRQAALIDYERSLREAEQIHFSEEIYDAHIALGFLLLDSNLAAASREIREAANVASNSGNRSEQVAAHLAQGRLFASQGNTAAAEAAMLALENDRDATPSIRWQAEGEIAHLRGAAGDAAGADQWYRRAIHTFQTQRSSLREVESTLPFLENGTDLYSDCIEHLIGQGKTDDALEVLDESRANSLMATTDPAEVHAGSPQDLTRAARAFAARVHGAILVYYLLPHTSYLWAVSEKRIGFYQLPGAAEIASLAGAHERFILDARDPLREDDPAGRKLYETLIRPAEALISPGSRVFLLADGPLCRVNFDTLVVPGTSPHLPAHLWIEDVTITNAVSLRLLTAGVKQVVRRSPKRILLLGDPRYPAGENLELPEAGAEVARVMAHFPPADRTVITGAAASPVAYQNGHPADFSYIHFVAHAVANRSSPLDSAVLLSGGPGKLYAHDILRIPLHADLVTISGCYSSGTRTYSGEGVVGLAWAFERAGARHVIGALWEVSDGPAPALMDRMYGELASGAPPDLALRDAKLAMLHSPGIFHKPVYWAPFQLYSNAAQ